MEPRGFFSEHTAEYLLTRRIVDALIPTFGLAVPVHYQATREGASKTSLSMADRPVRVVPVFARRPKIVEQGQDWVLMKVNGQLFESAAVAERFGCSVLVGMPLVTDLISLSPKTECGWFHLSANGEEISDVEIRIPLNVHGTWSCQHPLVEGPIAEASLGDHVQQRISTMLWYDAIRAMRLIRDAGRVHRRFLGSVGYQPFFVVLPGDETEVHIIDWGRLPDDWQAGRIGWYV